MSADEPRVADQLEGVPLPEERRTLRGHDGALEGLRRRLAQGRLEGGVLIHGIKGIGKASLAFVFAREVLHATSDEPGWRIDEQLAAGVYPNLFVLRQKPRDTGKGFYTEIRVEDVRRIRDEMHQTRGRAGHRVVIVDSIDDANRNAANAMLKVLEEPPPQTLFLLVSHRPGQLLPTIRSRCHALALRPVGDNAVDAVLRETLPELDADRRAAAVALAGGRPRRAFEAVALGESGVITELQAVLENPLPVPTGTFLKLADTIGADTHSALIGFAREIILDALADEARQASLNLGNRRRLASANELWEKALSLFSDADTYNLDARQTLVAVFDMIRKHVAAFQPSPAEP